MELIVLLFGTVIASVFRCTEGFGAGAPNYKCGDMLPSHSGIQPENSFSSYTLTASSYTYRPSETITCK
jgi:hypothetical protein